MSPEYGATIAICPIDDMTLDYLRLTSRDAAQVKLVEAYAKEQGLFRSATAPDPTYSSSIELDLSTVEPSLAGPKRPQDRVSLRQAKFKFAQALETMMSERKTKAAPKPGESSAPAAATVARRRPPPRRSARPRGRDRRGRRGCDHQLHQHLEPERHDRRRSARAQCRAAGLTVKPWVKTSLAPGSLIVTEYFKAAGLLEYLAELGFNVVGYGCTTCIGNSGPLPDAVSKS
jgi:aconitate hydratase